jgi:hypothetical protein
VSTFKILEAYLEDLINLYNFQKGIRELSCRIIIEFLQTFQDNDSKWKKITFDTVIPKLLQQDTQQDKNANQDEPTSKEDDSTLTSNWTTEQIAVALYIQKCYEPSKKDEVAVPKWMEQALLSDENLARFSNSLVATARAYPRRHVVWTQILQVLFPTDCTTVINPTVRYSKDGSSCIKSLFCAIVEPHLVTSTYECRAFALDLMHEVSRALPTDQLASVVPHKLRNLFLNAVLCSGNGNKKQQQLLSPLGQKMLKSLVESACDESKDLSHRVETAKFLFEMDPRFDSKTKTSSIHSLLLDKDIAFNVEHVRNLIDFLEMKIVSAAKNISDKQNLEHQRPEDSDSERRAELHCLEGYLELLSGTIFKMALKLNHADRLEIFQQVLFFLMILAFFDCSDLKVPQTKSKKKKNKKSGALELAVIHTAVQVGIKYSSVFDIQLPYAFRVSLSARFFSLLGDIASIFIPEIRTRNLNSRKQEDVHDDDVPDFSTTKLEILECARIGWAALEEYGAKLLRTELDDESMNCRAATTKLLEFVHAQFVNRSVSPNDEKIFFLQKKCAVSFAILVNTLILQMLRCSTDNEEDQCDVEDENDLDDESKGFIPSTCNLCQAIVQRDNLSILEGEIDEKYLSKPLGSLVEVLIDILGMKTTDKSRGASVRLLRDALKNVWSSSLTLLTIDSSSASKHRSHDADGAVNLLLEAVCGDVHSSNDDDSLDISDEEESIETYEDEKLFTSELLTKDFGESDHDAGQPGTDNEDEELIVNSSQLENLLLHESDEEQDQLEHHEGADSALARMIKLKQESRKNAQREKERAVVAHQLRCISLLETVLSSKYALLLSSETVILSLVPLLRARRELDKSLIVMSEARASGKGGYSEKRSLLDRITSVVTSKIVKLKINRDTSSSVVTTAETILAEAKRSPSAFHCKCCSSALMFLLKFAADKAHKESIGSFLEVALVEWSTKPKSKLHSMLFEDAITRYPVFAATAIGSALSKSASNGRSPFKRAESFHLLSLLFSTKEADAVHPLKLVMQSSVQSALSALKNESPMLTTKRCREVLKSIESMISYSLLHFTDRGTWELLSSLSPLLTSLGGSSKSDGVQKICINLVSNIAIGMSKIKEESEKVASDETKPKNKTRKKPKKC